MSIENNWEKQKVKNKEGISSSVEETDEAQQAEYAEEMAERSRALEEQSNRQKEEDGEKIEDVRDRLAAHSGEAGPEAMREQVRERYEAERGDILEDKFAKGVVDNGLNLIPFVGGAKMMYESVRGKGVDGKKLEGRDRIIHGALGAAAFALDFTGIGEVATEGVFLGKAGIQAVEGLANHLRERGDEKSSRIFERTARFMQEHPKATERAENDVDEGIRANIGTLRRSSAQRMAA